MRLVQRWQSLPPEQRKTIRNQSQTVIAAGADLRGSLGNWLKERAKKQKIKAYDKLLDAAMNPSPEFMLGKRIAGIVADEREGIDVADVAERVELSLEDPTFRTSIRELTSNLSNEHRLKRVEKYGESLHPSWLLDDFGIPGEEWTDRPVVADQILEILEREGLMEWLFLQLELRKDDSKFDLEKEYMMPVAALALERRGEVEWLTWDAYGLPIERLPSSPAFGLEAGELEGRPDVRGAAERLTRAMEGLKGALDGTTDSWGPDDTATASDASMSQSPSAGDNPELQMGSASFPADRSMIPVSADALDAFAAAWLSVLGPEATATREEIPSFMLDQWGFLDPQTKKWLPEMSRIWADIQSRWPGMTAEERETVLAKWQPVFRAFESRYRDVGGR